MQTGCIHQNINLENPDESVVCISSRLQTNFTFSQNIFNAFSFSNICIYWIWWARHECVCWTKQVVLSNSFGQNPSSHIILQDIGQNLLMWRQICVSDYYTIFIKNKILVIYLLLVKVCWLWTTFSNFSLLIQVILEEREIMLKALCARVNAFNRASNPHPFVEQ